MLVLIVRDMTGGIRKHIVTILDVFKKNPEKVLLVTNKSIADSGFSKFLKENPWIQNRIIDIPMRRSPHPMDLIQLIHLYFRLRKIPQLKIFHGHGAKGGLFARLLGKLLGAKTVYTPHGGSAHAMFGKIGNIIYSLIETVLAKFTDLFIFESKYSYDRFSKMIGFKGRKYCVNLNGVTVLENPKDTAGNDRNIKSQVRVGALGALRQIKGFDLLINAIGVLSAKGIKIEAYIFGEGEELANLQALATQRHVESIIHFLGITDDPLLEISKCDVVVQPSRYESFGYTALEAMSVGVPVIASQTGGLTEVIEDNITGLLFKSGDFVELAEKIEILIGDQELRIRLVQNAWASVQTKFNSERMTKCLCEQYKGLGLSV